MLTIIVLVVLIGFLSYRSVRLPGMALVGLYCMLAVEQWAQSQSVFFVERTAIVNLLFAVVAGFALTIRIYRRELRSEPYPLGAVLVILLFSYALLSTNWTNDDIEIAAIWEMWAPYIILQILIAPLLIAEPRDLAKVFAYQIFIGGLFAALIVFGTDYQGRQVVLGDNVKIVGNPLAIAELGGITIICVVMMTRLFKGDVLFRLIIASICLIAIIKSGSRGQLIALAFALAVAYPFTYSIKNPKIFVASALCALLLGYVVLAGLDTFWADSGRFGSEKMSIDYGKRIDKSARLLAAWVDSPGAIIFGLGNSGSYDMSINGSYPHFVPIEILCEEGIIGALIYIWMLLLILRESLFALRRDKTVREESSAFAILIGIIVYLFLISLKQGSLIGTSTFFMSVMIFSKAVAVTRFADRQKNTQIPANHQSSTTDHHGMRARA
jgi:hypothetical protein